LRQIGSKLENSKKNEEEKIIEINKMKIEDINNIPNLKYFNSFNEKSDNKNRYKNGVKTNFILKK